MSFRSSPLDRHKFPTFDEFTFYQQYMDYLKYSGKHIPTHNLDYQKYMQGKNTGRGGTRSWGRTWPAGARPPPLMKENESDAASEYEQMTQGKATKKQDVKHKTQEDESQEKTQDDSAPEYEKMTQENKVTKATKGQDVKCKTQEDNSQEKTIITGILEGDVRQDGSREGDGSDEGDRDVEPGGPLLSEHFERRMEQLEKKLAALVRG